jgi:hypothetical protein
MICITCLQGVKFYKALVLLRGHTYLLDKANTQLLLLLAIQVLLVLYYIPVL